MDKSILVVCQHYYPETFSVTNICEQMAMDGYHVTVLTGLPCYGKDSIYPGYEKEGEENRNGVRICRVKVIPRRKSKLSFLVNAWSFWKNSRRFARKLPSGFDAVFSVCLSPITAVGAANLYSKKHSVKHTHYCLDLWPESVFSVTNMPERGPLFRFLIHFCRSIYQGADEIIVSSPSFKFYFRDQLNLPKKKIVYIPQPPSLAKERMVLVEFSRRYNFIYAGNVGAVQRVEDIVLACLRFKERKDFCFHIFGSGSRLDAVKHLINENGLEHLVVIHPSVSPELIGNYYRKSTALVASLADDGSFVSKTIPNKLLTYFAFGKPVIAAMGGDGADVARQTGGCLVVPCSSDCIGEAFEKVILITESQREKMGECNALFFTEHLQLSRLTKRMETEILK